MDSKPNIYMFNYLKSNVVSFDQDESFTISRILSLANTNALKKVPLVEVSQNLLQIFQIGNVGIWSKVDRVCFVARDSFSAQLRLLSSSHNEKVAESILVPGYSCMIDENSSLINIKTGEIRIYDNIDHIISAYAHSNKKAQRSISLIHQSNIKSGITIPLKVNDRTNGFLFINSTESGAFKDLGPQDYTLLCLLQLVYESILSDYIFARMDLGFISCLEGVENKNQILVKNLKKDLRKLYYNQYKKMINFEINSNVDTSFLLTHRKYLTSVMNALVCVKNMYYYNEIAISLLSIKDNKLFSEITFDGGRIVEMEKSIKKMNLMDDVEFFVEKDKIAFSIKYESITDGLLYSV